MGNAGKTSLLLAVCFVVPLLVSAHQINPKVIKYLTGETITYHDHAVEEPVQDQTSDGDPRDESRTVFSYPEWYVVYSAQEFAQKVSVNHRPSSFNYLGAIKNYWQTEDSVYQYAQDRYTIDDEAKQVLQFVGISFTLEHVLVGAYENTIGRITELNAFFSPTAEDSYTERVSAQYGHFLEQTPWYKFNYWNALGGLWKTWDWNSFSIRALERRVIFTFSYTVKAIYAGIITSASEASFGFVSDETQWSTVDGPQTTQRYRATTEEILEVLAQGKTIDNIQGHSQILVSIETSNIQAPACLSEYGVLIDSHHILNDSEMLRLSFMIPVSTLHLFYSKTVECQSKIVHLYDY